MDIVMDALVDKLVPSTSAISGAIGDMISTALNNTLGRFLYMIVSMINWFISVAYQLFEVFSGQIKVSYKGEPTYLTSLFFENSTVSGIYWGMAVIGVVMCFAFTIIAVIIFEWCDLRNCIIFSLKRNLCRSKKFFILGCQFVFFLNGTLQFLNLLVGSMVNILGVSGAKPHVIVLVYASIT